MKVNLRKASVIQNSIRTAIQERLALITGTHKVQVWAVNDEALAEARRIQVNALDEMSRLEEILVNIREQVAGANVKSGVSALLAEEAVVSAQLTRLTKLAKAATLPSTAQLTEQARQISAFNEKNAYNMQDSFHVGVFSVADIEKFNTQLVALRRRRVQISESLVTLNISTEITIKDNSYSWLESLGIV